MAKPAARMATTNPAKTTTKAKTVKPAAKAKPRTPFAARVSPQRAAKPPNQAEIAYERLKCAIVTLAIAPNTPLNEANRSGDPATTRSPRNRRAPTECLQG